MKHDAIHQLAWSAFPRASEVVVQDVDYGHIGIGVQIGDVRKGIKFHPRRVTPAKAIRQLKEILSSTS